MTYPALSAKFFHNLAVYWKACRSRMSWPWFFRHCCNFAVLITLSALSFFLISRFVIQSVQVVGDSMYPTLINSGHYWLDRYSYLISQPQRDDIVAVRDPQDNMLIVKRIIATPGEFVCLKNGKVYVDGQLLREPYLMPGTRTYAYDKSGNQVFSFGDKYFVMGDNRNISLDSRIFGAVPRRDILGKVVE
jgi:signal peptidase I